MHPLVRNLYKEVIHVGRDYPQGLDKVRKEWKKAIRNPENCPSCYNFVRLQPDGGDNNIPSDCVPKKMHSKECPNPNCERELRKAVGKGRYMIREMIGVIQLKKYRSLRRRYDDSDLNDVALLKKKLAKLQEAEEVHVVKIRDDVPRKDD